MCKLVGSARWDGTAVFAQIFACRFSDLIKFLRYVFWFLFLPCLENLGLNRRIIERVTTGHLKNDANQNIEMKGAPAQQASFEHQQHSDLHCHPLQHLLRPLVRFRSS